MDDDDVFRIATVLVGLLFMPVGLYYRIRSYTGEKIDRWQEGPFILLGLRVTALAVFVDGFAWIINPGWMAWSSLPIPVWLRWVGVIVMVCGGCLWVWAVHNLGKNLTDTVITREAHTLVTSGPYRWIRHPFYTACVVGLIGTSIAMANWFILLAGGIVWFAFLLPRTRIEERNLIGRFGGEYREYMNRTRRFIPGFRK